MTFLTCKSIAEGPLPFRVYHAVHFSRIYLLKQEKQCERVPLPHADVAIQKNDYETIKCHLSLKAISTFSFCSALDSVTFTSLHFCRLQTIA